MSDMFSMTTYLPLHLLNGLELELELEKPEIAFHFDASNETWERIFDKVDGLPPFDHADQSTFEQIKDVFGKEESDNQRDLTYTIEGFEFVGKVVWLSNPYVAALTRKAESSGGLVITFESWKYNLLNMTGSMYDSIYLTDQYQNCRDLVMASQNRNEMQGGTNHFFNRFLRT
jgi:hypothetical protein